MGSRDLFPGNNWSHTLGRDMDVCHRKVFHRVYGSWGGWNLRNEEKWPGCRAAYTAKQSNMMRQYGGTLVHEAIKKILQWYRAGHGNKMMDNESLIKRLETRMRHEMTYSEERKWKGLSNPKRATLILYPHLVGADLHEPEKDEEIEKCQDCLRAFLEDFLPHLLELGPDAWEILDSLDKMRHRDFDLFMAPDLVYHEGDDIVIVDWKTGNFPDINQLKAYGLYIILRYKRDRDIDLDPTRILAKSVPLLNPANIGELRMDAKCIEEAWERINSDIDKLEVLHDDGVRRNKEAFPPTEHSGDCKFCCFEHFCEGITNG